MNKKVLGALFLIIAIVSIIFSVICFTLNSGSYEWNETYGGDAYTGIQNASAQAANNILCLNECVNKIAGFAFIIVGLTFASIGISALVGDKKTEGKTLFKETSGSIDTNEINENTHCYCCGAIITKGISRCPYCGEKFN